MLSLHYLIRTFFFDILILLAAKLFNSELIVLKYTFNGQRRNKRERYPLAEAEGTRLDFFLPSADRGLLSVSSLTSFFAALALKIFEF